MPDDNYIVRMGQGVSVTVVATPNGKLVIGGDALDPDPANRLQLTEQGLRVDADAVTLDPDPDNAVELRQGGLFVALPPAPAEREGASEW